MGCQFSSIGKMVARPVGKRETTLGSRQRRAQAEAPFSAEFRDSCSAAFSLFPRRRPTVVVASPPTI
jgi:hypothetical protein